MEKIHRDFSKRQPEHGQRADTVSVSPKKSPAKQGKNDVKFGGGRNR